MSVDIEAAFADELRWLTENNFNKAIGVAVSGGGDSTALLHLAARWSGAHGFRVHAITIDHGLRPEAAFEAANVSRHCAALGLSHDIRLWQGWAGAGNLQDAARQARRNLIVQWATDRNLDLVMLGHTADDQAETVLMRMARGSGVDGLAGMREYRLDKIGWYRPLLEMRRADLRDWLLGEGIGWTDDPSNDNLRFDRVKARQMLVHLSELGLTVDRLTDLAGHMRGESEIVRGVLSDFAASVVREDKGDLLIERKPFRAALPHLRVRLLARALQWVATAPYPPRFTALSRVATQMFYSFSGTLHGCQITQQGDIPNQFYRITREHSAVRDLVAATTETWDQRWTIQGPAEPGMELRPLGEVGIQVCPDWRATGLPRTSLLSSPAVWQGDTLIAAPLAGFNDAWQARIVADFHATLLSH
jgi:tRNA(Ile)-lysidine synthase